ncbi:MAG: enoyl-CoA hydratase/isomerase family protein [Dehalococcoidia bacterium]
MASSSKYVLEKPLGETVLYDKITSEIATVTLNRPHKHNALYPPDMFYEVTRKIGMAVDDDDVKVIILKGNGPSFCSGDDLNLAPYDTFGGAPGTRPSQRVRVKATLTWINGLYRSVLYCPKTIICQAHGWTIGVGLGILLGCDMTIAAESAKFGQRQQRVGFAGLSMGWQFILLFTVGYKRMREWQLSGRTLDAQEAKEWGVVNYVVPDDKLEEETLRWAKAVALNPADGLMIAKTHLHMMFDLLGMPGQYSAGALAYPLFTNLKWEGEDFNFLKKRAELGVTKAFAEREARWAELGF